MWQFHRGCQFFTARRYASAVFAVVVCSSVCLSVTSRYCIIVSKRLYGSNWFLSWRLSITYAIQKRRCKKIRVSLKVGLLISGTVSQTLDLENFATASRSRCQKNSSTVQLVDDTYDARRVVAGRREFIQSEQNRKQKGEEYTRHTNTKIFKQVSKKSIASQSRKTSCLPPTTSIDLHTCFMISVNISKQECYSLTCFIRMQCTLA